jgi:hypothetical protein
VKQPACPNRQAAAILGASAQMSKPIQRDKLVTLVRNVQQYRRSADLRLHGGRVRELAESARLRLDDAVAQFALVRPWIREPLSQENIAASHALNRALRAVDGRAGSIVMPRSQDTLELVSARGLPPDLVDLWQEFPADAPVPIASAVQGEPIWLSCVEDGEAQYPGLLSRLATSPWAVSVCSVPLMAGRRAIGGLGLVFDRLVEFDRGLREQLLGLGVEAGGAPS